MRNEPEIRESAPGVRLPVASTTPPPGTPGARRRRLVATTAVGGAIAFVSCALLVPTALATRFDEALPRLLRQLDDPRLPIGGHFVANAARDFTSLGGTSVLAFVVGTVAIYLVLDRRSRDALLVVAAVTGGVLLDIGLKLLFARERPSIVPHLVVVDSRSFPSGHSMLSAVVYLTLGALLARFSKRRATQVLPIAAAAAVTFLVGSSRIVLGVHYPTDVVAGWSAGVAWASFTWLVADRFAREGKVEGRQSDVPATPAG